MAVKKIVVFGAGGRGGRVTVAEALSRGHQVTAVVRVPARHRDLAVAGVTLVAGDVTDPDSVASVAVGHDAAINSVYRADMDAEAFYESGARALVAGLDKAGVRRLVVIGIGSILETSPGVRFIDAPDFRPDWRPFNLARVTELEVFRASGPELDWVVVAAPPTPLDNTTPRTGRYRVRANSQMLPYDPHGPLFTFSDLAVAVVDEAGDPRHHRDFISIGR